MEWFAPCRVVSCRAVQEPGKGGGEGGMYRIASYRIVWHGGVPSWHGMV